MDFLFFYGAEFADAKVAEFAERLAAEEALRHLPEGFDGIVVGKEDDLLHLSPRQLTTAFNVLRGPEDAEISRFESAEVGRKRLFARIGYVTKVDPPKGGENDPWLNSPKPDKKEAIEQPPAADQTTETEMAAAKKGSAKKAKKAKKASTPKRAAKPKKEGAATRSRIAETSKIKLLVEKNPKQKGSAAFDRFALYRNGMLVSTFLKNGGSRADLSWDRSHGFINIEE